MTFKQYATKFLIDFAEGAAAGAITAYLAAGDVTSPKALALIVILGAIDGAISAARRAVLAAKPA